MEPFFKKRTSFIFLFFCFLFLVIWGKAFKIQVLDRDVLIAKSRNQIFREAKVYPKRGGIYDRNGNPLALNIQTYSIFTIPKKGSYGKSYRKLAKIVPKISYREIKNKIYKRNRYTWLARKIELKDSQVEKIKKLKGIYIDSVPRRFYPNNDLASQLLGFVGIDNTGLAGLEYQFDKRLKGTPQLIRYVKDAKGRAIKIETNEASKKSEDLYLSIDKDLQSVAERVLKEAVVKHKAESGGIGVMDAETGEILAVANYPTFDPNILKDSKERDRKLSFISNPFEPGSVFKIFTVASALENKISSPDTNYYCNKGSITVDGYEINESSSEKKYEWLSVKDIIKYSSNVGTTEMAFDLTYPKLRATLQKFKIGKKTGIELPAESRGIFANAERVSRLSLSNISFGQGVATTGLQMLSAYSAIANGGYMVRPTILRRDKRKQIDKRRIIERGVADSLTDMLIGVIEDGTGSNAKVRYFRMAGKTGTSQRPATKGGYDGYISSFIGFPTNVRDRFVIYVYIDKPHKEYYGSVVAGPAFKEVAQYMLYKRKDFEDFVLGEQAEEAKVYGLSTAGITLRYKGIKSGEIPNFKGLDKRSASMLAEKSGIDIDHMGIGVVYKQVPKSGFKIKEGDRVVLHYRPPLYE